MSKLLLILSLAVAHAAKPPVKAVKPQSSAKSYQLGERWTKRPAEATEMSRSVFEVKFFLGRATATYLGNYNGEDLFLTVNHIVGNLCPRLTLQNELVAPNVEWKCKDVLFQQNDIDTAIISVTADDPKTMDLLHSVRPSRLSEVRAGLRTPLTLLGYGSYGNDKHHLQEDEGTTCVSLAPYEPELIHDPDTEWTAPHPVWSMPIGCSSSRGDSGGPAFKRGTNLITGIVWTGGYHGYDLKDDELVRVFEKAPKRLWTDFTYIVPAPKILKRISSYIGDRELRSDTRRTLKELLMARHYGD